MLQVLLHVEEAAASGIGAGAWGSGTSAMHPRSITACPLNAEPSLQVLMRNEYKVLLGLHSGRVPAELKEIYDELAA